MESFKILLFGISGISLIFWAAVIGLWHADMFPRMFKEDAERDALAKKSPESSAITGTGIMPSMEDLPITGLFNRGKYSRKSLVVANFNPIESNYSVNRLYTSLILSLSAMTFIIIGYGLHSGFILAS